jgi:hypothetical protein
MRRSHDRAVEAGASHADMSLLFAVHCWLVSWSRLEDRVSLGQLAVSAGLWDGDPKQLPHDIRKRVSARLRFLEGAGALRYMAGGKGHGVASVIGLPILEEDSEGGALSTPQEGGVSAPPQPDQGGYPASNKGGAERPQGGAPSTPHPVSSRRDIPGGAFAADLRRDGRAFVPQPTGTSCPDCRTVGGRGYILDGPGRSANAVPCPTCNPMANTA